MTRKPHRPIYHSPQVPDPDLYVPIGQHIKELMDRDKEAVTAAKNTVDALMEGFPKIYMTRDQYLEAHKKIEDDMKRAFDELGRFREIQLQKADKESLATLDLKVDKYIIDQGNKDKSSTKAMILTGLSSSAFGAIIATIVVQMIHHITGARP